MPSPFAADFDAFQQRIWLDTAHQGPLPITAVREAQEAITWKMWPHLLTQERFKGVPRQLRQHLADLIGAESEDVVLGNSASYGLHLLANGLPLSAGDEVLLVEGDFPATILPWLALRDRGINVRLVKPRNGWISGEELANNLIGTTRVFCCSWVHSFSGGMADVKLLGKLCREAKVWFVLNGSQGIGNQPFDVNKTPVDALVSVGFKWLLGPYGTGFAWLSPSLQERIRLNHHYWLHYQSADDLTGDVGLPELSDIKGAHRFDVFGTANFLNFKPWTAALAFLLEQGIQTVHGYNQSLVTRLLEGLDPARFQVISPNQDPRSNLVCLEPLAEDATTIHGRLRQAGIDVALRADRLRVSPHLFNAPEDIDALLANLNRS